MYRFDMHCHTKYGSIDSRITIADYVEMLRDKGYHGMLVSDHTSYHGYNTWKKSIDSDPEDFVVLRGIEYDTRDAGHFLVILPDGVHLDALSMRGMDVKSLIALVHEYDGIVGPAHPFGTKSSSAMLFRVLQENRDLIREFDFIEGFNACETEEANRLSQLLAEDYDKPAFGGSDSHDYKYMGMGFTDFEDEISCNDDLIQAVRQRSTIQCGGKERGETLKSKHAHAFYSVYGFLAYNRALGFIVSPVRSHRMNRAFLAAL